MKSIYLWKAYLANPVIRKHILSILLSMIGTSICLHFSLILINQYHQKKANHIRDVRETLAHRDQEALQKKNQHILQYFSTQTRPILENIDQIAQKHSLSHMKVNEYTHPSTGKTLYSKQISLSFQSAPYEGQAFLIDLLASQPSLALTNIDWDYKQRILRSNVILNTILVKENIA